MPNTPVMRSLPEILSPLRLHWRAALIVSAFVIAAACVRALETDEARVNFAKRKKKKELRLLADKISGSGQGMHRRYPTGDVVVSEHDLAEQFRKRSDAVVTALHMLLGERKVQKAPLNGYWKLNA